MSVPGFGQIRVSPESIRSHGGMVYAVGLGWLQDVAQARPAVEDTSGYGAGKVADLLREFHDKVVPVTLDYLVEVGEATQDLGIALGEVADDYEELEHGNLLAILDMEKAIWDLGIA